MRTSLSTLLACALVLEAAVPARGAEDAFSLFEEEAKVVTAARREQSISEVPLAVDVVTPEEIRASGATNIWDLLRFRTGMDVIDGRSRDGNRAVVSARGFPSEYASNLLVLVDGRGVYNASVAGVYWEELPVQLQDIERVEIVRGPGAALYGTGAGFGVVNIITKKPAGRGVVELDDRAGGRGLVQSFQAAEGRAGGASFRLSHTFQQEDGFPFSANPGAAGLDYLRKNVLDARADAALSDRDELELWAGGAWTRVGLVNDIGSADAVQDARFDNSFERAKLTHRFSRASVVEVTGSRADLVADSPAFSLAQDARQLQHDLEGMQRLSWGDGRFDTTYGTSYRNVEAVSPALYGGFRPRLEIYRGYLHQTVRLTDRLSVLGAFSEEASNFAGVRPNSQVAGVFALSPERAVRASYSRAYTLRDFIPVYADFRPLPGVRVVGDPRSGAIPYKIESYEAGYHATSPDKRLEADANLFYTEISGFHDVQTTFSTPPPLLTLAIPVDDSAIARGAELSFKYRFSASRAVYANYAYESVSDANGLGGRARSTPAHKLNLGGRTELGGGFSAGANAGYKDDYVSVSPGRTSATPIPAYWRLDARLAWALPWLCDSEAYVAGQNLLQPRHAEFTDGLAVPRVWAAGLSLKFR